jgi:hypothetical protein
VLVETCRRHGFHADIQAHTDCKVGGVNNCVVTMWNRARYAVQGSARRAAPRCSRIKLLCL